jgi:hypothetical protein
MTPMDLIQEDFPATPSTLYSTGRLFANPTGVNVGDLDTLNPDDQLLHPSSIAGRVPNYQGQNNPNASSNSRSATDQNLDHAMQQLYVSTGVSSYIVVAIYETFIFITSSKQEDEGGVRGSRSNEIMHSHQQQGTYGGMRNQNNPRGDRSERVSQGPIPTSYNELPPHLQGGNSGLSNEPVNTNGQPYRQPGGSNNLVQHHHHQQPQQQQPQGGPSPYMQHLDSQSPGMATPQSPTSHQIQQAAYYVQQPMYLDQNGQPMYYRVGEEDHNLVSYAHLLFMHELNYYSI